jgi:SAM-dependent methyltransferase
MRSDTLAYYDTHASEISSSYEEVDFSGVLAKLCKHLPEEARFLEIGCGSGRDSAYFCSLGYDVIALDGSVQMLNHARRLHPELHGNFYHHVLPKTLPFNTLYFDVVMSWAVLMHLEEKILLPVIQDIARILKKDGIFAYSVNTQRCGLDERGTDARGRHFTCLHASSWESLHLQTGFETLERYESDDITGRPGIKWVTFITRKR